MFSNLIKDHITTYRCHVLFWLRHGRRPYSSDYERRQIIERSSSCEFETRQFSHLFEGSKISRLK